MSAKTSAQQGRRTPLSLSGAVTKSQPNKGSNSIANGGGNNANGQPTSNSKQQENKVQQKCDQPTVNKKESAENSNKRQQPQNEKKQQQNENKKSNEKFQNGVNSNKQQETNENKQQQQSKEKAQQQNGKDDNKAIESGKSEKSEKSEKLEKIERDTAKVKEDKKGEQGIIDNKKEEKKGKEPKDVKDMKKEESMQKDAVTEVQKPAKDEEKKLKEDDKAKCAENEPEENIVKMDIVDDQTKQNSSPTPLTPKSSSKTNKASSNLNKTPPKSGEKTPQKSMPISSAKSSPVTKREVTTAIDENDIEMEPLAIESSPVKLSQPDEAVSAKITPSATSTPGKLILPKRSTGTPKPDVELADISPERPRMFSQITGRKSIRPISDYTPSKFQSKSQFRESYRRINTELDVTNTSMDVTVGSEVPNNLSFSFFGRGRKRDRTPTQHSQSAIGELQTELEISPPKKARLDMHGIFSAVASPLTLLRNRFSKASLQSSTPLKLQQKLSSAEDEIEVQNVSGISMHEEIAPSDEPAETSTVVDGDDVTIGEKIQTKLKEKEASSSHEECNPIENEFKVLPCGKEQTCEQLGINVSGTLLQTAVGDPISKNKKCVVM